jgi:hypothetical protein
MIGLCRWCVAIFECCTADIFFLFLFCFFFFFPAACSKLLKIQSEICFPLHMTNLHPNDFCFKLIFFSLFYLHLFGGSGLRQILKFVVFFGILVSHDSRTSNCITRAGLCVTTINRHVIYLFFIFFFFFFSRKPNRIEGCV